jgi:hypothetical protein
MKNQGTGQPRLVRGRALASTPAAILMTLRQTPGRWQPRSASLNQIRNCRFGCVNGAGHSLERVAQISPAQLVQAHGLWVIRSFARWHDRASTPASLRWRKQHFGLTDQAEWT